MTKRKVVTPAWESHSSGSFKRCYESHPALSIGDFKIYGGSCSSPIVKDADIYVGLDLSIAKSPKAYPWEKGESFLFHIPDMQVPGDPAQFKKLIDWLAVQLAANKKVHVGCIGGHGRTGIVLSALVAVMTGEKDAIRYVREHYCEKVVESTAQVDFLTTHFGILTAPGHKTMGASSGRWSGTSSNVSKAPSKGISKAPVIDLVVTPQVITPAKHPLSIWGSAVVFDKR